MDNPECSELNIEISANDRTDEELDRMTRQLRFELKK